MIVSEPKFTIAIPEDNPIYSNLVCAPGKRFVVELVSVNGEAFVFKFGSMLLNLNVHDFKFA